MQSFKTAVIVVLLLAMLYGVYTVLNTPPAPPPREVAELVKDGPELLQVEEGDDAESPANLADAAADQPEPPARRPLRAPPPRPIDDLESRPAVGLAGNRAAAGAAEAGTEDPMPKIPVPELTSGDERVARGRGDFAAPRDRVTGESAASPGADDASRGPVPPSLEVPETRSADQAAPPGDAPPATESAANAAESPAPGRYVEGIRFDPKEASFQRAMQLAKLQMTEAKWRDALFTLTSVYEDPRMSDGERQQLLDKLDPLAAKVIYSTENLVEPPYEPRRGETLMTIGEQFQVPWQLLQKINSVKNPEFLPPGTRLKVVRGPFRGEVDLARSEFTIYLNRLYAGRFPISIGSQPEPGEYLVRAKELGKTFFTNDGRSVQPADPSNPYGHVWIDLGKNVALHGSPFKGDTSPTGSIGLSPKDADDVFAILSQGSKVTIRR